MLDQVAERGYPATTVGDVVAAARCSRNAFYELFEDKEACYIAAADETGAEMLDGARLRGAQRAGQLAGRAAQRHAQLPALVGRPSRATRPPT